MKMPKRRVARVSPDQELTMAEQKKPQSDRATELDERQLDQASGGRGVITQEDPTKPTQPADPTRTAGGTGGGTTAPTPGGWDLKGSIAT
jgi:hypothetical protein